MRAIWRRVTASEGWLNWWWLRDIGRGFGSSLGERLWGFFEGNSRIVRYRDCTVGDDDGEEAKHYHEEMDSTIALSLGVA